MNIEKIREKLDDSDYWDTKVIHFSCQYFGDEVFLVYEYDSDSFIQCDFIGCKSISIKHAYKMDMPYKEMIKRQVPFYLQDIQVLKEEEYLRFDINAFPLYLQIECKDILIKKIRKEECRIVDIITYRDK